MLPGHFPGAGQFCLEQIRGQQFSAEIREPAGTSSILTATPPRIREQARGEQSQESLRSWVLGAARVVIQPIVQDAEAVQRWPVNQALPAAAKEQTEAVW